MEYFNSFNDLLWQNKDFLKKLMDRNKNRENFPVLENEKFMDMTVGDWIVGVTLGINEKDKITNSRLKVMVSKFELWQSPEGGIILNYCSPDFKIEIFKLLINEYLQKNKKELWLSDDEKKIWNEAYNGNSKYYDNGMEDILKRIKEGISEKGFYTRERMCWIEHCAENLDIKALHGNIQLPYNKNLVDLMKLAHKPLRDCVDVGESCHYSYSDLGFDITTYIKKEDRCHYLTELIRAEVDVLYFFIRKDEKRQNMKAGISLVCLDLVNGWSVVDGLNPDKDKKIAYLEMVNSQLKKIEEVEFLTNSNAEMVIAKCKNAFLHKLDESPILKNLSFIREMGKESLTSDDLLTEMAKTITISIDVDKYMKHQFMVAKNIFEIEMNAFKKLIDECNGELINSQYMSVFLSNNRQRINFRLNQPPQYMGESFDELGKEVLQKIIKSNFLELNTESLLVLEMNSLMKHDIKGREVPLKKHIGVKF